MGRELERRSLRDGQLLGNPIGGTLLLRLLELQLKLLKSLVRTMSTAAPNAFLAQFCCGRGLSR